MDNQWCHQGSIKVLFAPFFILYWSNPWLWSMIRSVSFKIRCTTGQLQSTIQSQSEELDDETQRAMLAKALAPFSFLLFSSRQMNEQSVEQCVKSGREQCACASWKATESKVFHQGSRSWSTVLRKTTGTKARTQFQQAPNAGLCLLKSHESAENSPLYTCWHTHTHPELMRQTDCMLSCLCRVFILQHWN